MQKIIFALAAVLALAATPAHAFTIAGKVGVGLGAGAGHTGYDSLVAPVWGGELSYGFGPADLGLFYDFYKLKSGAVSTSNKFMGAVGRFTMPGAGYFFDVRLGTGKESGGGEFSWGVGAGTSMGIGPVVSLKPRLGYNKLPASGTSKRDIYEAALLLAVGF